MLNGNPFAALALAVDVPSRLHLLNPVTRRPILTADTQEPAWIDLLAMGSAVGRAHDRSVTDRIIALRGRRMTAEEIDDDFNEKLGKLTKDWRLIDINTGLPLEVPCTPENARLLYSEEGILWIREQVVEFVNDLGHFTRTAPKP